jgi:hypothetical protein
VPIVADRTLVGNVRDAANDPSRSPFKYIETFREFSVSVVAFSKLTTIWFETPSDDILAATNTESVPSVTWGTPSTSERETVTESVSSSSKVPLAEVLLNRVDKLNELSRFVGRRSIGEEREALESEKDELP